MLMVVFFGGWGGALSRLPPLTTLRLSGKEITELKVRVFCHRGEIHIGCTLEMFFENNSVFEITKKKSSIRFREIK